ncbi:MAG TPA: ATP phosphoribosyltransferase regulatory subunit, partial [Stellaceae bacterium]|nr:ATP phosphoribosyltransferase regulatory subunit [Stellaceae bacterium]
MNDVAHPALLPTGLYDLLPPEAEIEAAAVAQMMAALAAHGYQRVKPPLVEFEETLLSGAGAAMAPLTFRMMDPASHRMVGLRADMTPQVARIAATRLGHLPRPLRLSYAGQVLRVTGSEIRPDRQVGQVGAELIGAAGAAADVEAIAVAAEALAAAGVPLLSVDLTLPTLVPAVCRAAGISGTALDELRRALDHKDAAAVKAAGGKAATLLQKLLAAAGAAAPALKAIAALDLAPEAAAERARLAAVAEQLAKAMPSLAITIDPVENRGFEYHTGVSFS